MNREVCKFLSGTFAGIAYAHAGYAVATSSGIMTEPIFLGRKWGVGLMWTEAVVYSAISLALGSVGWRSEPRRVQELATSSVNGQSKQSGGAAPEPLSSVSP
jgi:hypothetical protein